MPLAFWHPVPEPVLVLVSASLGLVLGFIASGIRLSCGFTRVLIVGTNPLAARIVEEAAAGGCPRYQVIGVVDDAADGSPTPGVAPWLGPVVDLGRIIEATRPSWIVMALAPGVPAPEGPLLEARMRGIRVEEAVVFLERATGKLAIEVLTPSSLILSDGFRHVETVRSDLSLALTRALSIVAAIVGLVVLAPLFAIVAAAIKLDSDGPVLFRHPRIGQGGRRFDLLKFRTMHATDDATSEWVCDNEHRITRVGRRLRRFRLDELPQFLNVLAGDMNLVGPRPHPVSNYALFLAKIPYYRWREAARPGITGWAQVRYGYANGLDEEVEKMRYDLYYIKHRGVGLDVRILFETVAVLTMDHGTHERARRPVIMSGWTGGWHRTASEAPTLS